MTHISGHNFPPLLCSFPPVWVCMFVTMMAMGRMNFLLLLLLLISWSLQANFPSLSPTNPALLLHKGMKNPLRLLLWYFTQSHGFRIASTRHFSEHTQRHTASGDRCSYSCYFPFLVASLGCPFVWRWAKICQPASAGCCSRATNTHTHSDLSQLTSGCDLLLLLLHTNPLSSFASQIFNTVKPGPELLYDCYYYFYYYYLHCLFVGGGGDFSLYYFAPDTHVRERVSVMKKEKEREKNVYGLCLAQCGTQSMCDPVFGAKITFFLFDKFFGCNTMYTACERALFTLS